MRDLTMRRVLTMGDVAQVCGVASRTASKWCDSGLLKSWRVPGSPHRRVSRDDLVEFMDKNGLPVSQLGVRIMRVLLATPTPQLSDQVYAEVGVSPWMELRSASSLVGLGMALVWRPHLTVLDMALGRAECLAMVPQIGGKVVLVAGEDELEIPNLGRKYRVLQSPVDVGALALLILDRYESN